MKKRPEDLRSFRWFGPDDLRSFGHRSRTKQMGYGHEEYAGKPVIAILNTWSDLNPCHSHFKQRVEEVKRGVWQAGGFPVELPVLSVTETFMKPSPMMYRNLLAMEVEEVLRSQPADGVVMMGGCDKTTPGLLMGAISVDLPAIYLPAGPMLRGNWQGNTLGSGSDSWKYWAERCAGNLPQKDWFAIEDGIARSPGHCMTMGTASTMTAIAEVLGFSIPGASSIPAVDANHSRMATRCGQRVVEMVWEDLKPSGFLTRASFENAITADIALGGSTNAIVHLLAIAGRAEVDLDLDDFDTIARKTPLVANLRPSGDFLMEDFFYAGGILGFLHEIAPLLHLNAGTVMGTTIREHIEDGKVNNPKVIGSLEKPVGATGSTAVVYGNLAPDGAIIKTSAASEHLLSHTGRAVVFEDYPDLKARINAPDLDVKESDVLVLKNAGPKGGPGMPEWGMLPIPNKLLEQGVRDMVRLSDARMSGTSYGTCVLHIAPESYVGGPLALVQNGDMITLDVESRTLRLEISDQEMETRKAQWSAPKPVYGRGFSALYMAQVTQANKGCDFEVLHAGADTPEPAIY